MGNNPSRQHYHQHHHSVSAGSQNQSSSNTRNDSPHRATVGQGRRGSLPHTPSPTGSKPLTGLYPIRVTPSTTTTIHADTSYLDPRAYYSDVGNIRRGSTGGVEVIGVNEGYGSGGGEASTGNHVASSGLPPQFRNVQPFHVPEKGSKARSFIAEETTEPPLEPTEALEGNEGIQRKGSMHSTTTVEEDDTVVDESKTIPTLVTWPHGGNKVYITGTFCGWRKKYRLTKSPENTMLSAMVPLPAGTHHVKFLVDGELRTSDALPTAVDSTGILINYLEVNPDDFLAPLERQPSPDRSVSNIGDAKSPDQPPIPADQHQQYGLAEAQFSFIKSKPQRYTDVIPAFLRDFEENQDKYYISGSPSGQYGSIKIPPPPTLPLMLGKVILNSSSHLKDDNSVLGTPNHVVLNHLATSSIKNHVLAVSATTRYKKKYVSTILYKSTTE